MNSTHEKAEVLELKRVRAELGIYSRLNTIVGLKSMALDLAYQKDKLQIAGILQETVFGEILDREETGEDAAGPVLAEAHMDLWKPFFEVVGDEELGDWLKDPEQAGPALDAKIAELKRNLEQLRKKLGGIGQKEGN
jgi:hypothetical protein